MANLSSLGIAMGTFYSGLLTPEIGMSFVAKALEKQVKFAAFRRAWACDCAVAPQALHSHMPTAHQSNHYYGKLEGFLSPPGRSVLSGLSESCLDGRELYEMMGGAMLELEKSGTLFASDAAAWCYKHQRFCHGCSWSDGHRMDGESDSDDPTVKISVAGSTCKAWSSRGAQRRDGDKSMIPFLFFIFLVRHLRPDVVVHECTMSFDVSLLQHWLGHLFQIASLVVSPELFGVPAARNRRYSMLVSMTSMSFSGTPRDFEHVFATSCEVDADVFFAAGEVELREEVNMWLGVRKLLPLSPTDSAMSMPWSSLYTPNMQNRLQDYAAHRQKHQAPSGCFVCNLQQEYGMETCGSIVPCLLASSSPVVYSFKHKRHMVMSEMFAVQGFDTHGTSVTYKAPWANGLASPDISASHRKELVGNAMHAQVVTACLLYTMARAKKVPLRIHDINTAARAVDFDDSDEVGAMDD